MSDTPPPATPAPVTLTVEADTHLHHSLHAMGVPPVKRVSVCNGTEGDLRGLLVEVTLGTAGRRAWQRRLERLPAGATHNFDVVELELDGDALRDQRERITTMLTARVVQGDAVLAEHEAAVEVLPLRVWPGLRTLPELLAAFVLPDDPAVADVLVRAVMHLRTTTGSGALDGYRARDPARSAAIARAVFDAVRDLSIVETPPTDDFVGNGQQVCSPGELVKLRRASCLELGLFYAGAIEQAGLRPLIVLANGRAFAGVWLGEDGFAEAALEDGLRLRKRVDLGEMAVIDLAAATAEAPADFEAACRRARRHLDELDGFACAVDVARCRAVGVLPSPASSPGTVGATPATMPADSPSADPRPVGVPRGSTPPATVPADESPTTRLDRWKRKLLDLSLRNRLINFRPTKLALRLAHADPAALEDALAGGADFVLRPAPSRDAARASVADPDARTEFLRTELSQRRIHTLIGEDELDARLTDLWRHARMAQEESGANVVFLALGTLRWYETPSSDSVRSAPLLLVPLEIERVSAREGFRVRLGEEDPRVNVTLLEKLAVEFQIGIDGLDELTEDENGVDVHAVLQRFRRAVRDIDRWDVADEAWIAPFSFSKFLMWRDLQEQRDALLQSPVLRHLVERPGSSFEPDATYPEPIDLDRSLAPRDTLCPLDADSSQLAAVVAAAQGRSFVLAGPPGTGKSQTIANLIAQCIAGGKRVLFVAEKMAALDVVRSRLARVGLGPFCLELHSKESSKRAVLDSLQEALDLVEARSPDEWDKVTTQLAELRDGLNAFVAAMHRQRPLGDSVYAVTAALIGLGQAPRVPIAVADAERLESSWVDERRETIDALRAATADLGALPQHPLRHVQRGRWETTLTERTTLAAGEVQARLAHTVAACEGARDALGLDVDSLPQTAFAACDELVRCVLATPGAADALLTEPGWEDLRPQLAAAVEDARQMAVQREHVREAFTDGVLGQDLEGLLGRLRSGMASFWPLSALRCRGVRATLRAFAKGGHLGANEELARRLEGAIALRDRVAALTKPSHVGARFFGRRWQNGDPGADGVAQLSRTIEWAARTRAALRSLSDALGDVRAAPVRQRALELAGSDRDALASGALTGERLRAFVAAVDGTAAARRSLADLLELDEAAWTPPTAGEPWLAACNDVAVRLAAAADDLPAWCHWRRTRAQSCAQGLAPLVVAVETGTLAPRDAPAAFERAYREAWLAATCDGDPLLRDFAGREHERRIQRFGELDRRQLELARDLVRATLAARVPRGASNPAASSELGILLRELAKKTRHKPMRRLFAETPNLLPLLKPCFLMSPQSVAQYLAPGHALFDVVVFDEASQITVSDAVGALARGRAGVVVGDSKQLPPTTFFQRIEEGEDDVDEDAIEELESILDECGSAGFRTLRLRWHYRSRHESLIAFSNWHYYDNALYTFPAAQELSPELGVSLVPVPDGVYDRSKTRTNRKEAESVVRDLLTRLRGAGDVGEAPSFGIVTFSQAQQALVETLLDEERRNDPSLEPYFGSAAEEPVFVKNLENVQGDERDVVLFSICYGPDASGKVAMSFGPLNAAGGERRLNVAITRARQQVIVHATLRPDQIDLSRTNAVGVRHLKTFLDYAARGPQAIAEALVLDRGALPESPFEQDVKAALEARGHHVASQVGCSGYRIDLAVRDPQRPGRFALGIECDGAFYHSAKTARDRDRLRQGVLERLGWNLVRVWSSDWRRSRERELTRIEQRLAEALDDASVGAPTAAPQADSSATDTEAPHPIEAAAETPLPRGTPTSTPGDPTPLPAGAERYTPAVLANGRGPFEAATPQEILEVAVQVLRAEAPVHGELLVRRVASCFDLPRLTAKTRTRVLELVRALPEAQRPVERDEFLWPADLDPATWTTFRLPTSDGGRSEREVEHIPPEEIANAAVHVVRTQVGIGRSDLLRQTASMFGFSRTGARVRAAMSAGIEAALQRGSVQERDGKVTAVR
ncbi:MAG: DUF3320 domain-containing protein [Planctomycetota bacterium]